MTDKTREKTANKDRGGEMLTVKCSYCDHMTESVLERAEHEEAMHPREYHTHIVRQLVEYLETDLAQATATAHELMDALDKSAAAE